MASSWYVACVYLRYPLPCLEHTHTHTHIYIYINIFLEFLGGLRQVDPLSLCLFVLVMDTFKRLLMKEREGVFISGF